MFEVVGQKKRKCCRKDRVNVLTASPRQRAAAIAKARPALCASPIWRNC